MMRLEWKLHGCYFNASSGTKDATDALKIVIRYGPILIRLLLSTVMNLTTDSGTSNAFLINKTTQSISTGRQFDQIRMVSKTIYT